MLNFMLSSVTIKVPFFNTGRFFPMFVNEDSLKTIALPFSLRRLPA